MTFPILARVYVKARCCSDSHLSVCPSVTLVSVSHAYTVQDIEILSNISWWEILLPLDSNIDFQKYTQILDANLWPFVAEDFAESLLCSRMTCTGTLLTSFHES